MERKDVKTRIIIIVIIAIISLIISIPVFVSGIEGRYGQDLMFHLNRIEGIVTELIARNFPVRLESYWMDGYGYPVSIYYGDILLYFPAILRLIGVGVINAYKAFIIIINTATVVVSYICFRKIFNNYSIAILCTVIYSTATYRLENLYVRAAVGEYCAMMFIPIIMYGIYRVYKADKMIEYKETFINATILSLGLSGLINTHILSFEMTSIVLIIIALILFKKTFTKRVLLTYIIAAVETIVVNLYFIVPFLDYLFTQDTNINHTINSSKTLQEWGIKWWEIFAFFKYPFADKDVGDGRLLATPGIACIAVMLLGLILIVLRKSSRKVLLTTVLAIAFLFVSSCYFPWDYLSENFRIGEILAQVQFPWRYIGIVVALSSLLAGFEVLEMSSEKTKRIMHILIYGVCCFSIIWFAHQYYQYGEFKNYESAKDLNSYDMGYIEYLRKDTSREKFTNTISVDGDKEIVLIERNGINRKYYISKGDQDSIITLPIVNYKGYEIINSDGQKAIIEDGDNNLVSFKVDSDYNGEVFLTFNEPLMWRISEIISILGVLVIIALYILSIRKKGAKK